MIDIGANFGVYTLSAAQAVGPEGRVWSFEPTARTAAFLSRSLEANNFGNVSIIRAGLSNRIGVAPLKVSRNPEYNSFGSLPQGDVANFEAVPITTLDHWAAENRWPDIDFIKLDAEGEEGNIVDAGIGLFTQGSPLVMFEVKHGLELNFELKARFAELGYDAYRLVPGLAVLAPFDGDQTVNGSLFNLFCSKSDRASRLAGRGLLAQEVSDYRPDSHPPGLWRTMLAHHSYTAGRLEHWSRAIAAEPDYEAALDAYCLAADEAQPPGRRVGALRYAARALARLAQVHARPSVVMSLARAAGDYGQRTIQAAALRHLLGQLQHGPFELDLPFLAPSPRFQRLQSGDFTKWFHAALLESLIESLSFSSMFGEPDAELLSAARATGFHSVKLDRMHQLIRLRRGREPDLPLPTRLLQESTENLNPRFWSSLMPNK